MWLSEGFATYFTLMFREHAYGRDDFVQGLKEAKKRVFDFYETDKDASIVHNNLKDMKDVLTYSLQYQKGAWVLHMLRNYVGEYNFRNGIRNYYNKYYNSNTTTEEFKLEMENTSGKDLDKFFDQWLYKGGIIKLDISWSYNERLKQIEIKIDQVQDDGYLFEMPVELQLIYDNKSRIEKIFMDKKSKKYVISSDSNPKEIKLDPHIKLLAKWNIN